MTQRSILPIVLLIIIHLSRFAAAETSAWTQPASQWKIGVAKVNITPQHSMWMAGYAFRDRPAEGKLTDLWAKALAFEDQQGKKAVIVTADLIRIPKFLSDAVRDQVQASLGLTRSQIILNSSHTHSGPELDVAHYKYRISPTEQKKIETYAVTLTKQFVRLVEDAFKSLQPASLYTGSGVARFAVNRRNNTEALISGINELRGPSDPSVPVMKAVAADGKILALLFGYACHATVLGTYEWSADYPGFAQTELEKSFPGAVALFFQGAGGDQNPLPRRSAPLAKQYGIELAAAVERVVNETMTNLSPELITTYSEVNLGFAKPTPTREELTKIINDSGPGSAWLTNKARVLRGRLDAGEILPNTYPYPIQVWKLGEQPLITLGGEIVVEYAIELKRIFGRKAFVMGYSNDVMEYIPSTKIIEEGGYEGSRSPIFTTPWQSDIELKILNSMIDLAEKAGLKKN
jgi:neutral ceramidase